MIRPVFVLVLMSAFLAAGPPIEGADRPEHAILFIIDGLHWQAPERLQLANIRALAAQGTSVSQAYCLMPYHPTTGAWAAIHTCSQPNPILVAGTLFLRPDHRMIQHSFHPEAQTAHVVNSLSYASINRDFSFSMMLPPTTPDSAPVQEALRLLEDEDIRFMRVHLQNTGSAGNRCAETVKESAWRHNIWGAGSPYVAAARNADRLLGQFVEAIRKMGKWNETLLVVTADHGQANTGWHPLLTEDSWITPLVFAGPGVARGRNIPYAEHIDIVPTICDLMGVEQPNQDAGSGRVLMEVREEVNPAAGKRPRQLKELNEVLKGYRLLEAEMLLEAKEHPVLENAALRAEREFYGPDRLLDWHETGSVGQLISHNRAVLDRMRQALGRIRED